MSQRILHHPVLGSLNQRKTLHFTFNESSYTAYEGETIAAALLASGVRTLRVHEEKGTPRGIYCNIGHCYECRVSVNGVPTVRACMTLVQDGMEVTAGTVLPTPLKKGDVAHG
ncbi:sarcosine oxidase subunit alpha [Brevibacillus reuszeri]|uniref:Sarcosine oxidase subunit alpha n=1 Tax=Brevibacillus reuszeri TaxID=54915 RepID=A0A0K9YJN0_9BACL|nr:(2Fe-2S)-binding protein [Brevibacillus reuszeri]KNB68851.1 sarcosine oxidase subunit alpha [Brevibacillus reuszeri]MED1859159.1 (2Fe-2S)-binding protein [Brevibacillus reuszeri]GED69378.1 sarcosine oxidase subunit alpha [Brevibacillus reuszeri]